mgnify:FL=1
MPARCFRIMPMLCIGVAMMLGACGGSEEVAPTPTPPTPPAPPAMATFSFQVRGKGLEERFVHSTTSSAFIAAARAQLALPAADRRQFPAGPIAAGNGGFNLNWGWHFTDLSLVEAAVEVCDGTPSMVQANLNYWLTTVRNFCPWAAYVDTEVK